MIASIRKFLTKLSEDRYFNLKFRLILLNTFFATIPLVIVVTITYLWIYQIVHDDFKNNLKWQMEETRHSIEFFISERISALKFIATSYPEQFFTDQKMFHKLFLDFKKEFDGIVDMGVVNSNGIQTLYVGPYQLEGKDYSQVEWFKEMTLKNENVTDVFLGYRKIPHFSIIVKRELPTSERFRLLRVSINMDILQKLLANLEIESQDDVFLVNKNRILQTNSKLFGNALEPLRLKLNVDEELGNIKVFEHEIENKKAYLAYGEIKNTPWIIVAMIRSEPYEKIPSFFTREVTMISIVCIALIFFVIATSINTLVDRVQRADREREIAIANAEHADKLASIGRLAAGVAHEINNPLAIINEKAGLMKDLLEFGEISQNKDRFIQLIDSIKDSVNRCRTITHRLLSFSKKIDRATEEFIINDAIKEVVGFIEKEIEAKGINIVYNFENNLPKIKTDKGQLQQVLLNIINNAVDAVDIGGKIEIKTELLNGNNVRIMVEDNGQGIPKDRLKHIFEPFYTTKKKGTGLGLYITYGIVKKLGGDIKVESEVGKGTVFTIELPINTELRESK